MLIFRQDFRGESDVRRVLFNPGELTVRVLQKIPRGEFSRGKGNLLLQGGIIILGGDIDFEFVVHPARVHFFDHFHQGDAGFAFAVHDRPLDWSGASIFREQRTMEVDGADARRLKHFLGDDLAIGHREKHIEIDFLQEMTDLATKKIELISSQVALLQSKYKLEILLNIPFGGLENACKKYY